MAITVETMILVTVKAMMLYSCVQTTAKRKLIENKIKDGINECRKGSCRPSSSPQRLLWTVVYPELPIGWKVLKIDTPLAVLRKSLSIQAGLPLLIDHLGRLSRKAGKHRNSKEAFDKRVNCNTDHPSDTRQLGPEARTC
jgi:hypothetical protein